MNNLYLKLHPSCIAWMLDNKNYGIIGLTSNLIVNGRVVAKNLSSRVVEKLDTIVLEKPFLKLQGDNQRALADSIIHVQRNFGMFLYILDMLFRDVPVKHVSSKVARLEVYSSEHISKDVQLSEASVLLKSEPRVLLKSSSDIKSYEPKSPLEILCLHDCLVLKRYYNIIGVNSVNR